MADTAKITEQVLSAINLGKTADVVYGHLRPVLNKLEENIVNTQIGEYRAGKFDAGRAQAAIAQLALLQDLDNALRTQMQQGNRALQRTVNQGE